MAVVDQPSSEIRRTRVEIDLAAIAHNAEVLAAHAGVPIVAVVKADGYGHGARAVARVLDGKPHVAGFAVSLVEEGVALRATGIRGRILILGPSQLGGEREMVEHGLTPVIGDESEIESLGALARRLDTPIDVHLKVDTGMSRLGVARDRARVVAEDAAEQGLRVVGLMSHFANADIDDPNDPDSMTQRQIAAFAAVQAELRAAGVPIEVWHLANSSGAMMFPAARHSWVRTGIALYGNGRWGADHALATPRRQAMRLVTEIAQIRTLAPGDTVGYGATWRAERETAAAVLAVGYADGLPRRASGKAEVLVRGQRCPLIGTISMDIAIADVTDLPAACVGDEVVLLGSDHSGRQISTAEYAGWSGLSEYEVTCGMSKRVPRTYASGSPTPPMSAP